jgi:hypothetical protein
MLAQKCAYVTVHPVGTWDLAMNLIVSVPFTRDLMPWVSHPNSFAAVWSHTL